MLKLCEWLGKRKREAAVLKQITNFATLPIGTLITDCNEMVPSPKSGSAVYNRIGNRVSFDKLYLKYNITPTNSNTGAIADPQLTAIAVVYDRQSNGSLAVTSDIFQSFSNTGFAFAFGTTTPNPFNLDRFTIVYYRAFTLPPIGVMGANLSSGGLIYDDYDKLTVETMIDLDGLEGVYGGGTDGSYTNVRTGQFWLITYSEQQANVIGSGYELEYNATLYFHDI